MSFKYINPGYGGLCYEGSTFPKTIQSYTFNPTHGVACFNTENGGYFSSGRIDACQDLYIKFDVYFSGTSGFLAVGVKGISCILIIGLTNGDFSVRATNNSTYVITGEYTNLKLNAVNTIYLTIHFDSETYVLININGEDIIEETLGDYSGVANIAGYVTFENYENSPISNIIISDEEINPKEIIIQLESSAVDTDMNESDGVYSSPLVGSYVLQILNTAALYSTFGSDCKILGAAVVASPAYLTDSEAAIEFLNCRVSDGVTSTDYHVLIRDTNEEDEEYTPLDSANLLDVEKYLTSYGRQLPITSETTLADLNGLKVGWVTGAY